jgi:hypothetical protein
MRSPSGFYATTLAVAGLLLMPAANAQDKSPPSAPSTETSPTTSPASIPDHKLDAAAAAVKRVAVVSNDFESKLAKAPADQKDRVLGEANAAITKAVTDQGLSVDEYMTIMNVAQNDPVVRDKLLKRLE